MWRARKEKKVSLRKLSEESGVNACTIASWESGARNATITNIIKVCNVLGCTVDEYCGREKC